MKDLVLSIWWHNILKNRKELNTEPHLDTYKIITDLDPESPKLMDPDLENCFKGSVSPNF